jgi:hypothetical protein
MTAYGCHPGGKASEGVNDDPTPVAGATIVAPELARVDLAW